MTHVAVSFILGKNELRIDFIDFDNQHSFAKYASFQVAAESDWYRLSLGAFAGGPAGESVIKSRGHQRPSP